MGENYYCVGDILFELNEGQENAKKQILGVINRDMGDNDKFITFFGAAGTGKTFTIQQIINAIDPCLSIGMTAPTHKAVKVMRVMAYSAGIDGRVDIRTIHSALGLAMKQLEGAEVLYRDEYVDEKFYDVLFVDECSMLDDTLLSYIIESCSTTIIFVGDKCQISPVDALPGEISSCFTEVSRTVGLSEVVRQKGGNPIIDLATKLRLIQDDIYAEWPAIQTNLLECGSGVDVMNKMTWFKSAVEIFKSKEFKTNPDYCRCIAYTNDMVDTINDRVRKSIHGFDVKEYLVDEILVAQSAGNMHKNAEEMRIMELEEIDDDMHNLPCWEMKLSSMDTNAIYTVKVLKSSAKAEYENKLSRYAERAKLDVKNKRTHWKNFWDLKKTFNSFKHVYAMTAHKSQGSTMEYIFVWTPDFLRFGATMEIKQLMYTATTRASYRTTFAY